MTIKQMNKVYGTEDTDILGDYAWILPVDITDKDYTVQLLILLANDGKVLTCMYYDGQYTNQQNWPTLSHAYAAYELIIKEQV